jgi:hypothetical protein
LPWGKVTRQNEIGASGRAIALGDSRSAAEPQENQNDHPVTLKIDFFLPLGVFWEYGLPTPEGVGG